MNEPGLHFGTRLVILTAIYFIGGLLGKEGSLMGGGAALVWPPAGIALAAILLFGYRFWPGVALGAIVFSFMKGVPSVYDTLGTVIGNTIGAIVCAFLLERFLRTTFSLQRVRDVVGFLLFACLIGTTVNAAFNAVGQFYAGEIRWESLFSRLMVWWVPNVMAALVVTPFILAWGTPSPLRWDSRSMIEGGICLTCLVLATLFSFSSYYVVGTSNYPFAYLPYPFLIWGALRFGPRGATTGTLVVCVLSIYGLLNNSGPFVTTNARDSVFLIGSYVGIVAAGNLFLAAATAERGRVAQALPQGSTRP